MKTDVQPEDPEDPYALRIRGVIVDEVSEMGPVLELLSGKGIMAPGLRRFDMIATLIEDCRQLAAESAVIPNDEMQELAFGATLVAADLPYSCAEDDPERFLTLKGLREFWRLCEKYSDRFSIGLSQSQGDCESINTWCLAIFRYCHNRKFVITKHGSMAMAPPHAREGDKVCVFSGTVMPSILRPEGNRWRLVGDVYVHGRMKGQYIQELLRDARFESEKVWFAIH